MRDENRAKRQEQIERATYDLLEEKGYAGTSMQGIARRSRASNETLYNWYGDKQSLFSALVARNAAEVRALLEAQLTSGSAAMTTLGQMAPKLLQVLLGNRAIALNRAAAADPTGELGRAISQAGRETILPLVEQVLIEAAREGHLTFAATEQPSALFIDLLVGDLQIRRVIGRLDPPTAEFCEGRAALAIERFLKICAR